MAKTNINSSKINTPLILFSLSAHFGPPDYSFIFSSSEPDNESRRQYHQRKQDYRHDKPDVRMHRRDRQIFCIH